MSLLQGGSRCSSGTAVAGAASPPARRACTLLAAGTHEQVRCGSGGAMGVRAVPSTERIGEVGAQEQRGGVA